MGWMKSAAAAIGVVGLLGAVATPARATMVYGYYTGPATYGYSGSMSSTGGLDISLSNVAQSQFTDLYALVTPTFTIGGNPAYTTTLGTDPNDSSLDAFVFAHHNVFMPVVNTYSQYGPASNLGNMDFRFTFGGQYNNTSGPLELGMSSSEYGIPTNLAPDLPALRGRAPSTTSPNFNPLTANFLIEGYFQSTWMPLDLISASLLTAYNAAGVAYQQSQTQQSLADLVLALHNMQSWNQLLPTNMISFGWSAVRYYDNSIAEMNQNNNSTARLNPFDVRVEFTADLYIPTLFIEDGIVTIGETKFQAGSQTVTVHSNVPEPATLALAAAGAALAALRGRSVRRRLA